MGIKRSARWFTLVCVSQERSSSGSFEELAMPLFERLYNFAHWLTQDRQEAEDLVQETYTKALKGFAIFPAGHQFSRLDVPILRNTFLTSRTGLKATATVPLELESEDEILSRRPRHTREHSAAALGSAIGAKALGRLPVPYREVLLLCEFEEMSYLEISSTLGVPMGTVMSRLSRARRALRNTVQELQGKGLRV